MADNTRRITINDDDGQDPKLVSFEAADAIPLVADDLEDERGDRQPIDLDAPADAFAAISAIPAPAAPEETPNAAPAQVSSVPVVVSNAEAEALQAQLKEANDKYLRTLAEFQNYKRRTDDDIRRRIQEGNEKLLQQILPSLDDFDLAIAHAKNTESYEKLIGGVEAMYRKLVDTLARQGVEPIPAVGEKFDAAVHEAVMLDEESDQPDETVTAELRKGYTLNGRVIRPSLVKVAKGG
ncbi:MAG: nucleotide exchange factor GrpE [Armatimonadetes bacterium]|nr:nucleotide exchange factor GrpE [Armatimonadota bacterium]